MINPLTRVIENIQIIRSTFALYHCICTEKIFEIFGNDKINVIRIEDFSSSSLHRISCEEKSCEEDLKIGRGREDRDRWPDR